MEAFEFVVIEPRKKGLSINSPERKGEEPWNEQPTLWSEWRYGRIEDRSQESMTNLALQIDLGVKEDRKETWLEC